MDPCRAPQTVADIGCVYHLVSGGQERVDDFLC